MSWIGALDWNFEYIIVEKSTEWEESTIVEKEGELTKITQITTSYRSALQEELDLL